MIATLVLIACLGLSVMPTSLPDNLPKREQCRADLGLLQHNITRSIDGGLDMVAVDVNKDGNMDVVSCQRYTPGVVVVLNQGGGVFGPPTTLVTGVTTSVAVGDVTGDSWPDIVATNRQDLSLVLFASQGSGAFGPAVTLSTSSGGDPRSAHVYDADGDGHLDAFFVDTAANQVFALENQGGGVFTSSIVLPGTYSAPTVIASGDVTGNVNPELIVLSSDGILVFPFDGKVGWGFLTPTTFDVVNLTPSDIAVGDLDGDGRQDVAITAVGGNYLALASLGDTGVVRQTILTRELVGAFRVELADIDGDADLDAIVSTDASQGSAVLFVNDGTAEMGAFQTLATFSSPAVALATADFDNDGDMDVGVSQSNGAGDDAILWLEQGPVAPSLSKGVVNVASGYALSSAVLADVDGDLDLDVVAALSIRRQMVWFSNSDGLGDFTAGAPNTVALPNSGTTISIFGAGDIDNDGDVDVLGREGTNVYWAPNTDGAGTFGPALLVAQVTGSRLRCKLGDFDGDLDLDVVCSTTNSLLWFENLANGVFASSGTSLDENVESVMDIVLAHLDDVPGIDVAVAATGAADSVTWYSGGTEGTRAFVGALVNPRVLVAGLVNANDSTVDLVTSTGGGKIVWYQGTGGAFEAGIEIDDLPSGSNVESLVVADIEGDGDGDIGCFGTVLGVRSVMFFVNQDGEGTAFATLIVDDSVPLGTLTGALLASDLDNDGDMDVMATFASSTTAKIFRGASRTAFFTYPSRTMDLEDVLVTDPSPTILPKTVASVRQGISSLSRCVQDTLVLEANTSYVHCPTGHHVEISYRARIEGRGEGTVFNCSRNSGVLFRAFGGGEVTLTQSRVVGTGTATHSLYGSPGLRVDGAESVLALEGVSVVGARAAPREEAFPTFDQGRGGAVVAAEGGTLVVSGGSMFSDCSAQNDGGALYIRDPGTKATVTNSSIHACSAGGEGGGIGVGLSARVVASSVVVSQCTASGSGGGALFVSGDGLARLEDVEVVDNVAESGGGGGILVSLSRENVANEAIETRAVLKSSRVLGNSARFGGGVAVLMDATSAARAESVSELPEAPLIRFPPPSNSSGVVVEMNDSGVVGNVATTFGGGLYVCGAWVGIYGDATEMEENVAGGGGMRGSTRDAYVCGVNPSNVVGLSGGSLGRNPGSLPWLVADPGVASDVLEGAGVHSTLDRLEWVDPPADQVQAGEELVGRVLGRDVLGGVVTYPGTRLGLDVVDGGAVLVEMEVTSAVLDDAEDGGPGFSPGRMLVVRDRAGVPALVGYEVYVEGAGMQLLVGTVNVTACRPGFGGIPSVVGEGREGWECQACSEGSEAPGTSFDECRPIGDCVENTVRDSGTGLCLCKAGFWVPSGEPDVACIPCPVGGVCDGQTARPVAGPGYFPGAADGSLFEQCPNSRSCTGGGGCAAGYESRLCAECADGYYRLRSKCVKCAPARDSLITVLLIAALVGVSAGLMVFNLTEGLRYKFAAASIGLSNFQVAAMYGRLDLDWGPVADAYFNVVSFFNVSLDITSPECSLASGVDVWALKWGLTLVAPAFVAILLIVVGAVFLLLVWGGVGWFGRKNGAQVRGAWVRTYFQIMVLLYLPLTSAAFAPFGCRRGASGRWILDDDPARSCFTPAWWAGLFPPGLVAVMVYGFGLPLGVLYVLWSRQKVLDPVGFTLRYGFLVGRFCSSAWWFEVAIMGRKLGVVLCMTFFFSESSKASAGVIVLVSSLFHLGMARPYAAMVHNVVASAVLGATSLILYAGTFADFTFRRVGIMTGVVATVVVVVVANVWDVIRIVREEKEVEEKEFFVDGVFAIDHHDDEDYGDGGDVDHGSFGSVGVRVEGWGGTGGAEDVVVTDVGSIGSVGGGGGVELSTLDTLEQ